MAKLALNGGPKVVTAPLGKKWPIYGSEEREALNAVLESGRWWRSAPGDGPSQTERFEEAFAAFQDARYGVALNSGTAALMCAVQILEIGPGDEVILPPCTFQSPAMAILHAHATPVFADVDPETYTIDPAAVEAAITPRTKAILSVDYGGQPCDMDALVEIAEKHGIYLISDCAHAHGSQWRGRGVGAIGHMGIFAFQGSKLLPCGEGGMILSDDKDLIDRAFQYHHAGRVPAGAKPGGPLLATNMRMTEWQSAVGLAQLGRLEEQILHREANASYLAELLQAIPGVANVRRDPRVTRWGFYFWSFKVDPGVMGITRDAFLRALQAEGVPCSVGQTRPLYRTPVFQEIAHLGRNGFPFPPHPRTQIEYGNVECPNAEQAFKESVAISHPYFLGPKADMEKIAEAVRKVAENAVELAG